MVNIVIYKTPVCPFCVKAKALLSKKGITQGIVEIDITKEDHLKDEMMEKSGGRKTVPQIFIDGKHVGGCDDLYTLDEKGELDTLLNH